jgi:hypothetical protein
LPKMFAPITWAQIDHLHGRPRIIALARHPSI